MIARVIDDAGAWVALVLTFGVIASALGAAMARSLYTLCMHIAAAGALAAAALLAHGAGDAALTQVLFGAGVAPFLLLAVLLLSTRAAKPMRRGRPWLTIAAAGVAASAILWAIPDLGAPAPVRIALAPDAPIAPWLAPLILVAGAACVALIGFGERGALARLMPQERD